MITLINYLKATKKISWLVFALIFIFTPDLLAADGEFKPDTSTAFLGVIFGRFSETYNSVFASGPIDSLLGIGFKYFNGFIASVGAAVIAYITIVALMNSASSGSPLGQKWHTLFLPLRITAGAGMLLPNEYGYNLAQSITMWFILTGVSGADAVWNQVSDKLHNEGMQAISGAPADGSSATNGKSADQQFMEMLAPSIPAAVFAACVVGASGASSDPSSNDPLGTQPASPDSGTSSAPSSSADKFACSPNPDKCSMPLTIVATDPNVAKICGSLTIANSQLKSPFDAEYGDELKKALGIMADFSAAAINTLRSKGNMSTDDLKTAWGQIKPSLYNNYWYPARATALKQLELNKQYESKIRDAAQKAGWILAGASYYGIIKESKGIGLLSNDDIHTVIGNMQLNDAIGTDSAQLNGFLNKLIQNLQEYINSSSPPPGGSSTADVNIKFTVNYSPPALMKVVGLGIPALIDLVINKVFNPAESLGLPDTINDSTSADQLRQAISQDPLQKLSAAGAKLTNTVEWVAFSAMGATLIGTLAGTITPFLAPFGTGIQVGASVIWGIVLVALQTVVMIFGLFYPSGIIMNVYIPLIPFMIYTVGVIGWLLLCIEAMAAAPIIAIGLMHPEGQSESLGRAEPGLMMMLNLMLRPVLMIIGLCAGIIVVRLALLFFSWGMNLVYTGGLITINSLGGVGASLMLFTGAIAIIVHKSFDLINKIPDKVLTWIGAQGTSVGESGDFLGKAEKSAQDGGSTPATVAKGTAGSIKDGLGDIKNSAKAAQKEGEGEGGGGGIGGA